MTATLFLVGALAAIFITGPMASGVIAQEKSIFIPLLSYRTGPYAPSGVPH